MIPGARRRLGLISALDRLALTGLSLGLAVYVMPWGTTSRLRWAFWLTLVSTILHIVTSHGGRPAAAEEAE